MRVEIRRRRQYGNVLEAGLWIRAVVAGRLDNISKQ
jgi:hypothetical protein